MATPDILHELKTLVRSMHPVVVVETTEEERLDELLRALAADLRLPLFTWTVTRGLQRIDGTGMIHGTADPRTLLRHLSTLTVAASFTSRIWRRTSPIPRRCAPSGKRC